MENKRKNQWAAKILFFITRKISHSLPYLFSYGIPTKLSVLIEVNILLGNHDKMTDRPTYQPANKRTLRLIGDYTSNKDKQLDGYGQR